MQTIDRYFGEKFSFQNKLYLQLVKPLIIKSTFIMQRVNKYISLSYG